MAQEQNSPDATSSLFQHLGDQVDQLTDEQLSSLAVQLPAFERLVERINARQQKPASTEVLPGPLPIPVNSSDNIMNSITDGLFIVNWDWQIVFINSKAAEYGGSTPEKLTGINLWEAYPRLLGTVFESNYRQVMSERIPIHFEARGVLRDTWYLMSVYPAPEGILVYWLDHTARKQTEENLEQILSENQQHKALLDAIFEADPDGIAVLVGEELRFMHVNPAYRFLCPDPIVDPIGKIYSDIWPDKSQQEFGERFRNLLKTGQPYQVHGITHRFADQTVRIFTLQARRIEWGGQPAVLVLMWDTTEQALAYDQAEVERSQLRAVLEALPVGIVILDRQGGILLSNPMYEQVWGGKPPATSTVDDYTAFQAWWVDSGRPVQAEEWASARAVQKGEAVIGQELRIQRFDGEQAYVINSGVPIHDANRQIVGSVVAIMDVTELRKTEAALQAEEAKLRAILDATKESIWLFDPEGVILLGNETAISRLKKKPEDVIGKSYQELLPPELAQARYTRLRQVVEEGEPIEFEDERAGINFLHSFYPVTASDGQRIGVVSFSRDITERKQAEHKVQEQEKKYQELFRTTQAAIYEVDFRTQRFVTVNDAMCQLSGYTREELMQMGPFALLDETGKQQFRERIRQWLSGEKPSEDIEYKTRAKDGREIFALLQVSFKSDANGQPTGATVIGHDITERKQAEQAALRQALLINQLGDAVIASDSQYRITSWNAAAEKMYGWKEDEVLGRPGLDIIKTEFSHQDKAQVLQSIQEVGSYIGEATQIRKDGTRFPVEVNSLVLKDENGTVTGYLSVNRDISERKQTEETLKTSEKRLRLLLEHSPDGVVVVGKDGTVNFVSPSTTRILGYNPEDLLGKMPFELIHPDEQMQAVELFTQFTGTANQVNHALQRIRHKNGSWRICQFTVSNLLDEAGINGIVANYRDVTEEHLSEEALRESEERFRLLADGTPILVWTTDAAGRVEFANQAYTDFFGVTIGAIQSGGWQPLVHPDDITGYANIFMDSLREQQPFRAQARVRRADGQWRWIESYSQPRFSASGEFLGMAGSSLDITENKETEARLARQADLLNNIHDAIVATDSQFRITYWNAMAEAMFGWTSDETLGRKPPELFYSQDPEDPDGQAIQKLFNTGHLEGEMLFRRKDGSSFSAHAQSVVLRGVAGEFNGVLTSMRDLSELKRVEERDREHLVQIELQRRLLEQREQERMQIARALHDGPLQEFIGVQFALTELLNATKEETLIEEIRVILQTVKEQTAEMRSYASELRPPTLMQFGLDNAILSHLEGWRVKHPEIKVHFACDQIGEQLPEAMQLPLYRIYQELMNNIAKHAQASEVHIHFEEDPGGGVRLVIRDNGRGFEIPSDWLGLARQGHLGLVGIRERVEAIGGELEIQSQPGHGTEVRVVVHFSMEKET